NLTVSNLTAARQREPESPAAGLRLCRPPGLASPIGAEVTFLRCNDKTFAMSSSTAAISTSLFWAPPAAKHSQ
ncbi:MAG: hypothetical protein L0H29_08540, partial [Sinobacteraceae bacterium]|nr:hypothetical protein [Nevskiaceae bacterium]